MLHVFFIVKFRAYAGNSLDFSELFCIKYYLFCPVTFCFVLRFYISATLLLPYYLALLSNLMYFVMLFLLQMMTMIMIYRD